MLPASYSELIRYDGAAVQRDERARIVHCAIQPRDVAVVRDIWRYKFLTSTQLGELHWPGCVVRVVNKRLTKLFNAGLVERFRPITRTGGSFPWTYQLGVEGHRLLRDVGELDARARFELRKIYDYRYVLHEIHLNSWVLAWRRHAGDRILDWHAETEVISPTDLRKPERLDDERLIKGLRDARPRLVRPDAIIETARQTREGVRAFLIEYDRTRRVDKNFEKFLRYDALLCWWWRHSWLEQYRDPPYVVFVCQDEGQLATFLQTADRELTGHLWHASDGADGHDYVGREQILFAVEVDLHANDGTAWRVPRLPRSRDRWGHDDPRPVSIPGKRTVAEASTRQAA